MLRQQHLRADLSDRGEIRCVDPHRQGRGARRTGAHRFAGHLRRNRRRQRGRRRARAPARRLDVSRRRQRLRAGVPWHRESAAPLNSTQPRAPNGVANSSGAVGRYLLTQANQDIWGRSPDPVYPYRGPQQTFGVVEFRDGAVPARHAPRRHVVPEHRARRNRRRAEAREQLAGRRAASDRRSPGGSRRDRRDSSPTHRRKSCRTATTASTRHYVRQRRRPASAHVYRINDYTKRGLPDALAVNAQASSRRLAPPVSPGMQPYLSSRSSAARRG